MKEYYHMMTILRHYYRLSFCLVEKYLIFSALLGIFFFGLVVATMSPTNTDDVPCNLTRLDYYFYLCMFQVRNTKNSDFCRNETRPSTTTIMRAVAIAQTRGTDVQCGRGNNHANIV